MALYLGRDRVNINLGGILYRLNLLSNMPIYDGVKLLSSDGYILQDSTGLYLVPMDYIEPILDSVLLSSDGYILQDSTGLYLVYKEE